MPINLNEIPDTLWITCSWYVPCHYGDVSADGHRTTQYDTYHYKFDHNAVLDDNFRECQAKFIILGYMKRIRDEISTNNMSIHSSNVNIKKTRREKRTAVDNNTNDNQNSIDPIPLDSIYIGMEVEARQLATSSNWERAKIIEYDEKEQIVSVSWETRNYRETEADIDVLPIENIKMVSGTRKRKKSRMYSDSNLF